MWVRGVCVYLCLKSLFGYKAATLRAAQINTNSQGTSE